MLDRASPTSLDVVLLLDDTRALSGRQESETYLFVSEAVAAIEASLRELGHRSRRLSFELGLERVLGELKAHPPDVVIPLGQPDPTDPTDEVRVTGLLELLELPHTSEPIEALVLACDKARAKALFKEHGIPSPGYAVSRRGELPSTLPPAPWIAKPSREDGSVGIACEPPAARQEELAARLSALHARFRQPILVETFVGEREFQIGILGNECLPLVEIDFSRLPPDRPRSTGYASKWDYESVEFKHTHYVCPAEIPALLAARLEELAQTTRAAFGLRRCSRLDVRVDGRGEPFLLDVNPNPDLSPVATFPKMANAAGWGYTGLVARLLALALAERRVPTSGVASGAPEAVA